MTSRSRAFAAEMAAGTWPLALALYGAIAVVLWLPFGLHTTGLVEEWDLMWLLDRGEQLWWITGGSALAALRLRPLTAFPHALAHALGDGFLWFNLEALITFALKGLATFLLVDRLAPRRRPAALVAGALAMLYPANTGLFTFRVVHIQIAVVLFLFGLVLLASLAQRIAPWRVALMWVLTAASLLMYQIATAALVVGPVVLALAGVRGWRRLAKLSALWFAAPAAVAVYWLTVALGGGTYEFESTQGARPSLGAYWHDLVRSYVDQVARAWRPSVWVTWKPEYVILGVLCGAFVAVAAFLARNASSALGRGSSLAGGLGAIAIAPLGFLPLWAIVASIHETLKVYLLSSIAVAAGAALLVGFVCRTALASALVGGALVALAAIYGLHQHAHYTRLAHGETRVLGELVQQLPAPADGTTIVVRDRSGTLSMVWTLGPPVTFGAAVEVAYHNPTLTVVLCDQVHHHAYSNGVLLPSCPLGRDPSRLAVFDYDLLHELRLVRRPEGRLAAAYAPLKLAGKGPTGRGSLFGCDPIQHCTDPPSADWPRRSIHETFDAEADNVTGYRPPESVGGTSFRWSDTGVTHVFAFLPARAATFELSVLFTIDPAVLQTIRLTANGRPVPVEVATVPGRYVVKGRIPAAALEASPDDLEVRSRAVPVAGSPDPLGLAVSHLDVTPAAG